MKTMFEYGRRVGGLALALNLIAASAMAAAPPGAPTTQVKQPAPARLAAALSRAGIKRCAPIVQRVAEFLWENGDAGFQLKLLGADADTSSVVVTLESNHPTLGTTRYATILVAPKETCSGYYEQTIFWAAACPVVKQSNFANFPNTAPLLRNIQASAASPTVSLYLMPAGAGCVSIKKEIFH